MVKRNNTLNNYITQLLILGVIYFVASVGFSILTFRETETTALFLPFIILGGGFAYYISTFVGKGGNVNYYFTPHTPTENEKTLGKLIEKYRNIWLMTIVSVGLLLVEIALVYITIDNTKPLKVDYFIGSIFMTIVTVAGVCEGAKFMTAWWNIKNEAHV